MKSDDMHDSLFDQLRALPAAASNPGRDERVRARCHAGLEKRRRHETARADQSRPHAFDLALVGVVCLLYLTEMIQML